MQIVSTIVGAAWVLWLVYWVISAAGAQPTVRQAGWKGMVASRLLLVIAVLTVFRLQSTGWGHIPRTGEPVLAWTGLVLTLGGLGLAVWARVHLGRNWGTPMAHQQGAELVTSGPYSWLRHPIYTGLIVALFGTAAAVGWLVLLPATIASAYFVPAAWTEDRELKKTFGESYLKYQARTKMLVPFVY